MKNNNGDCFIRKNTPELIDKLKNLGFDICPCTQFKNSVWLDIYKEINSDQSDKPYSIHGVGYWDEFEDIKSLEESLGRFLDENQNSQDPAIDCGENEQLFIILASYNPKENVYINQCFWYKEEDLVFCETSNDGLNLVCCFFKNNLVQEIEKRFLRKATLEELIDYFK